jgi:hypothetical protein
VNDLDPNDHRSTVEAQPWRSGTWLAILTLRLKSDGTDNNTQRGTHSVNPCRCGLDQWQPAFLRPSTRAAAAHRVPWRSTRRRRAHASWCSISNAGRSNTKPLHNRKVGLDPYHELGCGDERPRCSSNRGGANCSVEQLLQPRPTPLPRKVTNTCGYHSRSFPSPELNDWRWLAQDFPRAAATNPLSGPFSLCVFVSGWLGFPTHRYNRGVCGSLVYTPRSEFVRISEILALIRDASDAPMVEVRAARRVQPSSRQRGASLWRSGPTGQSGWRARPANGHGELHNSFRGEEVGLRRNHPRKTRPDRWGPIDGESGERRVVRWSEGNRPLGFGPPSREGFSFSFYLFIYLFSFPISFSFLNSKFWIQVFVANLLLELNIQITHTNMVINLLICYFILCSNFLFFFLILSHFSNFPFQFKFKVHM